MYNAKIVSLFQIGITLFSLPNKKHILIILFFKASIHPKTGNYYVLSANAHRLVVMNRNGKTLSSVALDPKLLRQPEGICFSPDGTLFIASEGDGKKGYLLQFDAK